METTEPQKKQWGPKCQCGHKKSRHGKRYGEQGNPRTGRCLDCPEGECRRFMREPAQVATCAP